MQYDIIENNTFLTVVFTGKLTALDLIFMNQNAKYRHALGRCRTLFLDFSAISGSDLTPEDTQGLALLCKQDANQINNIKLVILLASAKQYMMKSIFADIFANSSWQVDVVTSYSEAQALLKE